MSHREIVIFVPCYFDGDSFLKLKEKVALEVTSIPGRWKLRFVLIDDSAGSDASLQSLERNNLTVLPMPKNKGHQAALTYALRETLSSLSASALIVTMDADGEDRPEDLRSLLLSSIENPDFIILAQRTERKESLTFKIFYSIYKILFKCLTGVLIKSGNFALMPRDEVLNIIQHPSFDVSYASSLVALAPKIKYVPCPRAERYYGKSHMSFFKLIRHGVRMLYPFKKLIIYRFRQAALLSFVTLIFVLLVITYRT